MGKQPRFWLGLRGDARVAAEPVRYVARGPEVALHRLIYISQSRLAADPRVAEEEIASILAASRCNNRLDDLTGALLLGGTVFGQVLEGALDPLEATFARIERDHRHEDVMLLDLSPIPERSFGDWTMAYVSSGRAGMTGFSDAARNGGFTDLTLAGARLHGALVACLQPAGAIFHAAGTACAPAASRG